MTPAPFQILPELSADDFNRLKASIRERGVEVPVVVDEDGEIIDGHHRAEIAAELGIDYSTQVIRDLNDAEKRVMAVRLNVARRQLTDGQRVIVAEQIQPRLAEIARKRRLAGLNRGTDPGAPLSTHVNNGETKGWQTKTQEAVAREVGIGSGQTLLRHKKVIDQAREEAPELLPFIESGDLTIADVKLELRERTPAPPTIHAGGAFDAGARMVARRGRDLASS